MNEQFMNEMSDLMGVDFRADVPEGQSVGVVNVEGNAMDFKKPTAQRAHWRGVALPERVALYDIARHDISMVPPDIAQDRVVRNGRRFTTKKPANWHDSDPVYIEETCLICDRDPERTRRAEFTSRDQLTTHYMLMHEKEWVSIENDRRDAERREDQTMMRNLIASIATMIKPGMDIPAEVREQVATLQSDNNFKLCPECGESVSTLNFQYARHMKAHKKGGD